MKIIRDWRLWASIIIITSLGLLSGIFAMNAATFYESLILPVFAPPAWLFGPVWIILYIFMGITFYLIYTHEDTQQKQIMVILFTVQFILNFIWSGLFFAVQSNLLAVIDITLLWIVLFMQQAFYSKYKPKAMWLMGPYFLWVSFAGILNYAILFLN